MAVIELQHGKITLVDDEDVTLASQYRWHVTGNGYVQAARMRNRVRTHWLLHRLITDAPPGTHVDHINGDTLDNRRCNLRVVTPAINQANRKRLHPKNTSGIRGVARHSDGVRWVASIMVGGRRKYLGLYARKEDAAAARRAAELRHFGELCPTPERSNP